jgi:hypothetical protein
MRNDGHRDSNAGLAPANAALGGSSSGGSSGSSNVVGVHYKVGKKIGEGSFGVIFEGESRSRLMATYAVGSIELGSTVLSSGNKVYESNQSITRAQRKLCTLCSLKLQTLATR